VRTVQGHHPPVFAFYHVLRGDRYLELGQGGGLGYENMTVCEQPPFDTWTKQGICWPKDLLPKEPALLNVRILSFGYDSRVVVFGGQVGLNSLFKHSISLLNGLCRERDDTVGLEFDEDSKLTKQQNRPIIFIAHSLGGLIVKDVCFKFLL
jgi:hypothetical protein